MSVLMVKTRAKLTQTKHSHQWPAMVQRYSAWSSGPDRTGRILNYIYFTHICVTEAARFVKTPSCTVEHQSAVDPLQTVDYV